jgi:hypothetical protein
MTTAWKIGLMCIAKIRRRFVGRNEGRKLRLNRRMKPMRNEALRQLGKIFIIAAAIMLVFTIREFLFEPQIREIGLEWVSFPNDGTFILYSYSLDGSVQNIYLRSEEEIQQYRTYLDRIGRFTK